MPCLQPPRALSSPCIRRVLLSPHAAKHYSTQKGATPNTQISDTVSPKAARAPTATFKPKGSVTARDVEIEHFINDPESFLQQEAESIVLRRARATLLSSKSSADEAALDDVRNVTPAHYPAVGVRPDPIANTSTDYTEILELFGNPVSRSEDLPSHGNVRLEGSTKASHTASSMTPDAINEVALIVMEDVSASLVEASRSTNLKPEVAMWDICEEKIFPLTRLAITQKVAMGIKQASRPSEAVQPDAQSSHPLIPATVPIIPLLSQLYPAALLLALRLFQHHAPASTYCLSLLPHIKSLGPTSYVLGANTHFYNTLLAIMWNVYSDLNGISNLLAEMHHNGLEHNRGTLDLLRRINRERKQDFNIHETVENSRGAEWWKRPLVRQSWDRLREWHMTVAQKVKEQEFKTLMKARRASRSAQHNDEHKLDNVDKISGFEGEYEEDHEDDNFDLDPNNTLTAASHHNHHAIKPRRRQKRKEKEKEIFLVRNSL